MTMQQINNNPQTPLEKLISDKAPMYYSETKAK